MTCDQCRPHEHGAACWDGKPLRSNLICTARVDLCEFHAKASENREREKEIGRKGIHAVLIYEHSLKRGKNGGIIKPIINRFVVLGADSINEARTLAERRFMPMRNGWAVSNVVVSERSNGESISGEIVLKGARSIPIFSREAIAK